MVGAGVAAASARASTNVEKTASIPTSGVETGAEAVSGATPKGPASTEPAGDPGDIDVGAAVIGGAFAGYITLVLPDYRMV